MNYPTKAAVAYILNENDRATDPSRIVYTRAYDRAMRIVKKLLQNPHAASCAFYVSATKLCNCGKGEAAAAIAEWEGKE